MEVSVLKRLFVWCVILAVTIEPSWPAAPQISIPIPEPSPRQSSARLGQSLTMLPSGNWLILGGETKDGASTDVIVQDPRSGKEVQLASKLKFARSWHTATLLPNGAVLVLGGQDKNGLVSSAEVFDPASLSLRVV